VETLIAGVASARLLLILTYRPEYAHHWGSKSYYTQLHLDVLSWEVAGALRLRELEELGGEPLREEGVTTVSGWVTHRLGGFPAQTGGLLGGCIGAGHAWIPFLIGASERGPIE